MQFVSAERFVNLNFALANIIIKQRRLKIESIQFSRYNSRILLPKHAKKF